MKNFLSRLPASERRITISTMLTMLRILLIPWIAFAIVSRNTQQALLLLALACVTDVLDGWLARVRKEQTALGALLDPLADKLMTMTLFGSCMYVGTIPVWFFVVSIVKELLQILGGVIIYRVRAIKTIHANFFGKAAMVGQVVVLLFAIGGMSGWYMQSVILPVVVALMIVSFVVYAKDVITSRY